MVLGIITRNCKDFTNPSVIKTLYTSLVRSKFEYNTVLKLSNSMLRWYSKPLPPIHGLQMQFISYSRMQHSSYKPLLHFLEIASLPERRKIYDMKFF